MSRRFEGWASVAARLRERVALELQVSASHGDQAAHLNAGQRASLVAIAKRIEHNGVVIADEVGMGKTRIATALARCVVESGGRVAVLVPPGLGFQWKAELGSGGLEVPDIVRSLAGYLEPWQDNDSLPWFKQPLVLVSHVFANWHMGASSHAWRWSLLPHVIAQWRKSERRNWPTHYQDFEALHVAGVRNMATRAAAISIVGAIDRSLPARRALEPLDASVNWPRSIESESYAQGGILREALQRAVGIGLGSFDLVLLDEAHKSRGNDSGLSRLLDTVLLCAKRHRRVALTATPVELEVQQWRGTLARIGVDDESLEQVVSVAEDYAEGLRKIRAGWRTSAEIRAEFQSVARTFQTALSPYVLRRDKREDVAVIAYAGRTERGWRGLHDYRDETREIAIEPHTLSARWRQALCAAEALSFVAKRADGHRFKQLRLTMSHGHGVSSFAAGADLADGAMAMEPQDLEADEGEPASLDPMEAKRQSRLQWWRRVVARAGEPQGDALFKHPVITRAVEEIEQANREGEKVLVFGRFTAPMQALVDLLNARELMRRIHAGLPVAQSKIHESQALATDAAYGQWEDEHGTPFRVPRGLLDDVLKKQYDLEHRRLERSRAMLIGELREGFAQLVSQEPAACGRRHRSALDTFCDTVDATGDHDASGLVLLHRALTEVVGVTEAGGTPLLLARAFVDLLDGAMDLDTSEEEAETDDEIGDGAKTWELVVERLAEEYDRPQGGFARMMHGPTSQASRRMIQQAFNRVHGHPAVLVAQSLVGREGLNLHGACRIVVLLHPEWNPAVVEQQIGRVDRVGSHWARQVAALKDATGDQLPRIEVRPVVFKGTYGEHNWNVLRGRWDDLRAQLHGMVIPQRLALNIHDKDEIDLIEQVMAMAPNFSPLVEAGSNE